MGTRATRRPCPKGSRPPTPVVCRTSDAAEQAAVSLAETLGEGWIPDIWENLGWHYRAISPCGRIKVHPGYAEGFRAFLGEAGCCGGRWTAHGETPQAAVAAVVARGRSETLELLIELGALLAGLE